jgi:hypothetical protein
LRTGAVHVAADQADLFNEATEFCAQLSTLVLVKVLVTIAIAKIAQHLPDHDPQRLGRRRMASVKSVHVVPAGDEWAVEEGGLELSLYPTQAEAVKAARVEAIRTKAELVVHGRDGRIERKNSFGNDPRSVKG